MKVFLDVLGYIYYRLAKFEEFCWFKGHISYSGGFIGLSLALYVVNICHYLDIHCEINIHPFYKLLLLLIPQSVGLVIASSVFVKEKYKTLKEKYKYEKNRTLKGFLIVLFLVLPIVLLFTWIKD